MITKITKEQQAKIPKYVKKWIDLASQPIDRDKSKSVIKTVYNEDKTVIFGESLENIINLILFVTNGKKLEQDSQLYSQNIKWNNYSSYYLYDWAGYYDFAKMMGVEFNEDKLKQFNDILLNIPIIVFVGNILFICEKPKCEWENNLLHSIVKPAVNWADGTGIFFLEGIKFEKDLWEKIVNKTIPAKELLTLPNQDQKVVALKTYGWKRLLDELKPKILDEQNIIINGELLNHQVLEVNQDGWIGRFLKFTDPADKDEGLLRVSHLEDSTKTVSGARAYGFKPLLQVVGAQDFEFGSEG